MSLGEGMSGFKSMKAKEKEKEGWEDENHKMDESNLLINTHKMMQIYFSSSMVTAK